LALELYHISPLLIYFRRLLPQTKKQLNEGYHLMPLAVIIIDLSIFNFLLIALWICYKQKLNKIDRNIKY
jgi:hypothetical protein